MEQMTIYDFLDDTDVEVLKENESKIVERLSEKTGLNFTKSALGDYRASINSKGLIEVDLDYYDETHKPFIGVTWHYKTMGGGCPCDTLNEAYEKIKQYIARVKNERKQANKYSGS